MSTELFTFFWDGPFSQWYPAKFTASCIKFNCAEQFMMWSKATTFDDLATARLIMEKRDPRLQKQLGRKVKDFDPEIWDKIKNKVVEEASFFKFSQNPLLLQRLYETEGTTLVEASPYDKIWGIGLAADDPKAENRSTWQGQNLLGEILTEVRGDFMNGNYGPSLF